MGIGWNIIGGLGQGLEGLSKSLALNEEQKRRDLALKQEQDYRNTQQVIEREKLAQTALNQDQIRKDAERQQLTTRATGMLKNTSRYYGPDQGNDMLNQPTVDTLQKADIGANLAPMVQNLGTGGGPLPMPILNPGTVLKPTPDEAVAHDTRVQADKDKVQADQYQTGEQSAEQAALDYFAKNPKDVHGAIAMLAQGQAGIPASFRRVPTNIQHQMDLDKALESRQILVDHPMPTGGQITPAQAASAAEALYQRHDNPLYLLNARNIAQRTAIMDAMHKLHPEYDLNKAALEYQQAAAGMKTALQARPNEARAAVEQMDREIDNVAQSFSRLNPSSIRAADWAAIETGQYLTNDPKVRDFITAMSALRGSYSNFLKNGGGTDMSLKQAIDVLPTAMDKPVFKDLVKQLKNQVSIRRDIFQPSNYIQRNIGMDNPYADSVLGSGAGLPAAKPEPTFDLVADPTAPGGYRMVPHVPKIGGGIQ